MKLKTRKKGTVAFENILKFLLAALLLILCIGGVYFLFKRLGIF
jgi:hypothetical protein